MRGSVLYGGVIAIAFALLTRTAPQPAGSIVFWLLMALQLAWASVVCWRRTALPLASAAMAMGSATSVGIALLADAGQVFPFFAPPYLLLVGLGVFAAAVLNVAESRVSREKWKRWSQHAERQTLLDTIVMRNIPDLRDRPDDLHPASSRR